MSDLATFRGTGFRTVQCKRGVMTLVIATLALFSTCRADDSVADATTLRGSLMVGYQGWFRCPGDAAGMGWIHWSRDWRRFTPASVSFEMWPDMSDYGPGEKFAVPGFTYPDGSTASLFSSDNAQTVLRHFKWMRDYGIDGAWLQHFVIDLPGAPAENRYPSRRRVLQYVADAAQKTGRTWALTYDLSGVQSDRVFDLVTTNWKALVDERIIGHGRYLHEQGLPVVQIWGFYRANHGIAMTPDLGERLTRFFHTPGKYAAFMIGGGDWRWRDNAEPAWQSLYLNLDGYAPWNTGNYAKDKQGIRHASMNGWSADRDALHAHGKLWIPVIYPGFSWDNLTQKPPGTSTIARRGGQFLWEQFYRLATTKPDATFIAMFDEVDEGTAIFKVTSSPPAQAHFQTYDGLPTDWYLRVVKEGHRMLKGDISASEDLPIKP